MSISKIDPGQVNINSLAWTLVGENGAFTGKKPRIRCKIVKPAEESPQNRAAEFWMKVSNIIERLHDCGFDDYLVSTFDTNILEAFSFFARNMLLITLNSGIR